VGGSGSWKWQAGRTVPSILPHAVTAPSHGDTPHRPHEPRKLLKLLLNTKTPVSTTERCTQRMLKKRVRHSNVQKLPVSPRPGVLPRSQPPSPRPPAGCGRVPGLPVPWRNTGHLPCTAPASPACGPPCPRPGGEKPETGETPAVPKPPVRHLLLEGAVEQPPTTPAPTKGGWGAANEPPPPKQGGQARVCTRTQHLPLGMEDRTRPPPPSPGETEAQRGAFVNWRSLVWQS